LVAGEVTLIAAEINVALGRIRGAGDFMRLVTW
jgi:hypothetical protein